mmetsp:Transcript_15328/g.47881  ORF Transcript_15328/g.47881 Transcript_15328/m.47881 type:complete len:392 (-) Transcript_15328:32-1207(-)
MRTVCVGECRNRLHALLAWFGQCQQVKLPLLRLAAKVRKCSQRLHERVERLEWLRHRRLAPHRLFPRASCSLPSILVHRVGRAHGQPTRFKGVLDETSNDNLFNEHVHVRDVGHDARRHLRENRHPQVLRRLKHHKTKVFHHLRNAVKFAATETGCLLVLLRHGDTSRRGCRGAASGASFLDGACAPLHTLARLPIERRADAVLRMHPVSLGRTRFTVQIEDFGKLLREQHQQARQRAGGLRRVAPRPNRLNTGMYSVLRQLDAPFPYRFWLVLGALLARVDATKGCSRRRLSLCQQGVRVVSKDEVSRWPVGPCVHGSVQLSHDVAVSPLTRQLQPHCQLQRHRRGHEANRTSAHLVDEACPRTQGNLGDLAVICVTKHGQHAAQLLDGV